MGQCAVYKRARVGGGRRKPDKNILGFGGRGGSRESMEYACRVFGRRCSNEPHVLTPHIHLLPASFCVGFWASDWGRVMGGGWGKYQVMTVK